jgi:ankyrin repeat protein
MPQFDARDDYSYVLGLLASGTEGQWRELEELIDGFPGGVDQFIGRRWVTNAIDAGSMACVEWMIARRVELRFRDEEGYTVIHSALKRKAPDRQRVLEMLLKAGADVNARGVNDWTPAHMAAVGGDVEALQILIKHGADLSARTNIDDYATPVEEARVMGAGRAVAFLESLAASGRRPK